ncbi:uncharacterized protein CTRU02_210437 [Colletotrichum truncatum]|uniref:Uncharacterized protein n=1 Tax=Colletotrichum truncatum TaxID=5467 RepID=A0ACC3YNZ9_COLTU
MKSSAVMVATFLGLANAVNIQICKHQTMRTCVTMNVIGCTNFPSSMNDQVSSLNTGNTECTFYEHGSCEGGSWTTRGRQNTVPSKFNDKFTSVRC